MQAQLRAAAILLVTAASGASLAADRPFDTPAARATRDRHLGVASCAGSTCHGTTRIADGRVRQDEYLVWQRQDAHAKAYATLRTDRSRRIAANLGLPDATAAQMCLVCHSDEVPAAERGTRYLASDGVGCEACHGGSERWLSPHVRGYTSHAARLAAGLYPTWEPVARAELCLSCHQGSAARPMTHAIMGAGHPPLLFELDTFGALQPPHYQPDADYVERKGKPDNALNWAVGQLTAARGVLAGLAQLPAEGVFPELVYFRCNACHHAMQPPRWEADPADGLPPGRVRIADAALHQTALWLDVVKPDLAARWHAAVHELHQASQRSVGELRASAAAARQLLEAEALPLAARHRASPAQLRALALEVIDGASGPRATDFAVAEQAAMATAVFVTALADAGTPAPKGVSAAIDAIYAAVADRDAYDPAKMRQALALARTEIAKAYK